MALHQTRIVYQSPNIAYIPILQGLVHHAFSWGLGAANMAYGYGRYEDVKKSESDFLDAAQFSIQNGLALMEPAHKDTMIDIDARGPSAISHNNVKRCVCDAIITRAFNQPIAVKPADCTVSILFAENRDKKPILAVIHAGRNGLDLALPAKTVQHILTTYDCEPSDITVGVVPSITVKNHFIRSLSELKHLDSWEGCIEYRDELFYLNFHKMLEKQFVGLGVLPERIMIYDVDTYEAASQQESFSHRHWQINGNVRNGRFMVVAELKPIIL